VQTDHSVPGNSGVTGTTIDAHFGHNAMFYVDQATKQSKRFLVGPVGCEITGLAYTPDLKTFFVNIQHPENWPSTDVATTVTPAGSTVRPRASTVVIQRNDGGEIGV